MRSRILCGGLMLILASCSTSEPDRAPEKKASRVDLLAVTDDTFDKEVLQSKTPVLVDFWAPWCGPCLALAPIVEELADDFAGKIRFIKVDVDEAPRTAARYDIRSIPRLMLFRDGKVARELKGLPRGDAKSVLTEWLHEAVP